MSKNKDETFYLVRHVISKLQHLKSPTLKREDRIALGVKVYDLDLDSGKPSDAGQQYCKLFPERPFRTLLKERESDDPWAKYKKRNNEPNKTVARARLERTTRANSDQEAESNSDHTAGSDSGQDSEDDYWHDADPFDSTINTKLMLDKFLFHEDLEDFIPYNFCSADRRDILERLLYWEDREGKEKWLSGYYLEPKDSAKIHRACILQNNIYVDDDTLLRSELLCAASLMLGKIRRERDSPHRVFPIFVYSLVGYEARILQIHYDIKEKSFVVRKTKYFPFETRLDENTCLMLRWIMNEPCGDTTVDP